MPRYLKNSGAAITFKLSGGTARTLFGHFLKVPAGLSV